MRTPFQQFLGPMAPQNGPTLEPEDDQKWRQKSSSQKVPDFEPGTPGGDPSFPPPDLVSGSFVYI